MHSVKYKNCEENFLKLYLAREMFSESAVTQYQI